MISQLNSKIESKKHELDQLKKNMLNVSVKWLVRKRHESILFLIIDEELNTLKSISRSVISLNLSAILEIDFST